jgi:hypothetical protein
LDFIKELDDFILEEISKGCVKLISLSLKNGKNVTDEGVLKIR